MDRDADLDLGTEMLGEDVRRSLGVLAILKARKEAAGRLEAAERQADHAHDVAHRALVIAEKANEDITRLQAASHLDAVILRRLRNNTESATLIAFVAVAGVWVLAFAVHVHREMLENLSEELRALRAEVSR